MGLWMTSRRTALSALLYSVLGFPTVAAALEFGPKQVAGLLLRVLAYDRNLKARTDGKVVQILILFQEGNQDSEVQQLDMLNALEDVSRKINLATLPVKVSALPVTSVSALDARLATLRASALFVCTGLGDSVSAISALCRKRSILTLTANTSYVKQGLGIGFSESDDRIQLVVNLPAARAEGADLDASLLRVAEVYR